MPASSEGDNSHELLSGVDPGWLGNSVWQVPDLEVSRVKSWPSDHGDELPPRRWRVHLAG